MATWRHVAGRRYGPYYRLAFRDHRRQCSLYLGRDPDMIEAVRGLLAQQQHTHRNAQTLARLQRKAHNALRAELATLRQQLTDCGVHLKGLGHVARVRRKAPGQNLPATPSRPAQHPTSNILLTPTC